LVRTARTRPRDHAGSDGCDGKTGEGEAKSDEINHKNVSELARLPMPPLLEGRAKISMADLCRRGGARR